MNPWLAASLVGVAAIATPVVGLEALSFMRSGDADEKPTLTVESPSLSWGGRHFAAGAGQFITDVSNTCTPSTCDYFAFDVDFSTELPPPWPGLEARITWPHSDDDFDLYLLDGWNYPGLVPVLGGTNGGLVTSSTSRLGTTEFLHVPELKPGSYTLIVAPVLVVDSAYNGNVQLVEGQWGP